METYLLDGRCSLSNHLSENSIRPFTVGRNNWEFSLASTKDTNASTIVYSLVETARANGLNIYKYLQYLFQYMPDVNYKKYPANLRNLMP